METNRTLEIKLPSNRKFGLFFSFVFAIAAVYLFYFLIMVWAYASMGVAIIFLFISIVKSEALLPLNKLWMRFGFLLGMIISPIVLGVMFFGLFTPIATLMRLSGRDELKLKFPRKASHWILRNELIKSDTFKNQF